MIEIKIYSDKETFDLSEYYFNLTADRSQSNSGNIKESFHLWGPIVMVPAS